MNNTKNNPLSEQLQKPIEQQCERAKLITLTRDRSLSPPDTGTTITSDSVKFADVG